MKLTGEAAVNTARSLDAEIKEMRTEIAILKKERDNQKRFMNIDREKAELQRIINSQDSYKGRMTIMQKEAEENAKGIVEKAQTEAKSIIADAQKTAMGHLDNASIKINDALAKQDAAQKKLDSIAAEVATLEDRKKELKELETAHELRKKSLHNKAKETMKALENFTNG